MSELKKPALLLLGHGSSKHPESSRSVRMHAELLQQSGQFSKVSCAFLKEEPLIDDCLAGTDDHPLVIVPDFLAEGYFTRQVIPKKLNLNALPNHVRYCPPVGTHPLMAELILDSAKEVLSDWNPAHTSLLVVGHGSGKNPCSKQTLKSHLAVLRESDLFAQVDDLWLEEPPLVDAWNQVATQQQVIILPFLLNDGQHGGWDIPAELGIASGQQVHGMTHEIQGRKLRVTPALGTSARFTEAISAMAEIWG